MKTKPITVFLVFENGIDWSDGRSYFKSVHGSLDEAKEKIPEGVRSMEREPDRKIYGEEYVLDYTYYTIQKRTINLPIEVLQSS